MSSSWAPNETSYEIFVETTWLQSGMLVYLPCGSEITLFFMCFVALLQNTNSSNYRRQVFLLAFITLIVGLEIVFIITNDLLVQQAFIQYRNYPGGPGAYLNAMFSDPAGLTNSVSWMVHNWLLDVFLVWRFVVIYRDFDRTWFRAMLIIPCMVVLATISIAIIVLKDMAEAAASSNSTPAAAASLTISFYVMSLAMNIIVTLLIAGRLLVYRHRVKKVLGAHHATCYANIAAILVESAVLYSAFAITFLVTFALNSPVFNIFLNAVYPIQAISAYLIIFRVATGKAWTDDTSTELLRSSHDVLSLRQTASIRFASNLSPEGTDTLPASDKDVDLVASCSREVVHDQKVENV